MSTRTVVIRLSRLPQCWRRFARQPRQRPAQPRSAHPCEPFRTPHVSYQTLQQIRQRIAMALDHGVSR